MTSFAAELTVPAQQRAARTRLFGSLRASLGSVVDTYRAAAAHEQALAAATGRRVLDDVTSGVHRTLV